MTHAHPSWRPFAAVLVLGAVLVAFGETSPVVVLDAPPTPVDAKQLKVKVVISDPGCPATISAELDDADLGTFLKKSASSKAGQLSHTFRIRPKTEGTSDLRITVDYDDPGKEDEEHTSPITITPGTKALAKPLKVAVGTQLKATAAAGKAAAKALSVAGAQHLAGFQPGTLDDLAEQQAAWEVARGGILGDFFADVDAAQQQRDETVQEVLEDAGWSSFGSALPDDVQKGSCGRLDTGNAQLEAIVEKTLAALAKLDSGLDAKRSQRAGQLGFGLHTHRFVHLRAPIRAPSLGKTGPPACHVPWADTSAYRISDDDETRRVLGASVGGGSPGGDLVVDIKDLFAGGDHEPVAAGPAVNGVKSFEIQGLKPGNAYSLRVTDLSTDKSTVLVIHTPGIGSD